MLNYSQQMEIELREQMRGGQGTVKITHIFKENLPGKCRLLAHVTLQEESSIGFHNHEMETEIYYFLKGSGKVDDNGEEKFVAAGDAMHTGGGLGHAVHNTGKGDMEFIAVIILD